MPKLRTQRVSPPSPSPVQYAMGLHIPSLAPKTYFFSSFRKGRRAKKQVTIGRDSGNDIRIAHDRGVSREHALLLSARGKGRMISDQHSTNGIYVNGDRLEGAVSITVGMHIILGRTLLIGVDRDGSFPIRVIQVSELARLAAEQYGNCRIAGEHIGRSKEFVRVRTLPDVERRPKRSRRAR